MNTKIQFITFTEDSHINTFNVNFQRDDGSDRGYNVSRKNFLSIFNLVHSMDYEHMDDEIIKCPQGNIVYVIFEL